jgi:purine-binding chemotaxis protein CheW
VQIRVHIGGEHYALSVDDVREAADIGDVTPLPGSPRPCLGVRNLRGEVLPVLDLATMLGISSDGEPRHILVAQSGELRAGLAVESILGVDKLPPPDPTTAAPGLKGSALVDGMLVGYVDVPAALAELAGSAR